MKIHTIIVEKATYLCNKFIEKT